MPPVFFLDWTTIWQKDPKTFKDNEVIFSIFIDLEFLNANMFLDEFWQFKHWSITAFSPKSRTNSGDDQRRKGHPVDGNHAFGPHHPTWQSRNFSLLRVFEHANNMSHQNKCSPAWSCLPLLQIATTSIDWWSTGTMTKKAKLMVDCENIWGFVSR